MAAAELEEVEGLGAAEVAGLEEEEAAAAAAIIGSTLTPACPTCSRALSRNTSTRCTSGQLTWRALGTGVDQDTATVLTPTHTHTGFHQPT